eukprot:3114690-Alexandrium_andersonii.AAC.1
MAQCSMARHSAARTTLSYARTHAPTARTHARFGTGLMRTCLAFHVHVHSVTLPFIRMRARTNARI